MIYDNLQNFLGFKVKDYALEDTIEPNQFAYAVRTHWEDQKLQKEISTSVIEHKLRLLAAAKGASKLTHLVIGFWEGSSENVIRVLCELADQMPSLEHIFFGDIIGEENEISWIEQTNNTPLLHAYPELFSYSVRGGEGLQFKNLSHKMLTSLVVQTGGLSASTIVDILDANLPELTNLELWLGDSNYGATGTAEHFKALFAGKLFPKLTRLALKNAEITDDLAIAFAKSPLLASGRIRSLDLSMGTLTDRGLKALLNSPHLQNLNNLIIEHHFCSDQMVKEMKTKCSSSSVFASIFDKQAPESYDNKEYYYVSVSE